MATEEKVALEQEWVILSRLTTKYTGTTMAMQIADTVSSYSYAVIYDMSVRAGRVGPRGVKACVFYSR